MEDFSIANPGLCGQGHFTYRRESIVVLEIAYLVRDELRRQGAEVVMTREDEYTFITSIPRADVANDAGADGTSTSSSPAKSPSPPSSDSWTPRLPSSVPTGEKGVNFTSCSSKTSRLHASL